LISRSGPLQISYRVQAGALPESHWIRGPEGGGRLIGEAVHMIDLCRCLVGVPLRRAAVLSGGGGRAGDPAADNFQLGLAYEDGSTATILYTSRGSPEHPKERLEAHWDGRTIELDDFRRLRAAGRAAPLLTSRAAAKGQREQWQACLRMLLSGAPAPVDDLFETSRAAIALEEARRNA
jgi:predicted dehydrogenase